MQLIVEHWASGPWLTMLTTERAICSEQLQKLAGILILLAGLAVLVDCQGISAGGSSNQPQTSNLSFANAALNFGSVPTGNSKTLTLTASNAGNTSITISSAAISTRYFSLVGPALPATIAAGQSATVTIKFAPNAAGSFDATLSFTSNASNALTNISLSGTGTAASGGQLALNPTNESFGNVTVGATQPQPVTLTNVGTANVYVSNASVVGGGFVLTGIAPLTLGPNQSTSFTITFAPQSTGNAAGTLTITSDGSNPTLNMALSGSGVSAGELETNLSSLSFGSVQIGKSQSLSETVTNTGGTSVTISQVGISGSGFSLNGVTAPMSLTAGQSATFNVAFTPKTTGNTTGTVTITSNASNPTLTIGSAGTGVAPGTLSSNPTSLSFGNVTVGSNQSLAETVTNTGGTSITISQAGVSGSGFSLTGITTPVTLAAGQSANFSAIFKPTSSGTVSGTVTLTSSASNPTLTVPITGTGVTPGALQSNPASLSFGSVIVGSNQSLGETITNTGGLSVTISQIGVTGGGFSLSGISAPLTLSAGQSASFNIIFSPTSTGDVSGDVTLNSNASNPTLTIPVTATGTAPGTLESSPSSLGFGSVTIGSSQSVSEKLTNTGGSTVTISQIGSSGTGFSVSGITASVTLTAGQSVSFSVSFKPVASGSASGNLTVTSSSSNPTLTIPLTGTGVTPGALASNPATLSFGNVTVGSNQSLSETVTNTGGTSVTISQVGISGSGFTLSGITAPVTLSSGQSATFNVTFTPTTAGSSSGSVTITSNGSNPTLTIGLSGTGVAPGVLGSNPTSLSFGNVTVGSNQSLSETVTNTGGTSVTISQVGVSGSGFTLSGITAPLTLSAGQSATFSVTFTPTTAASASGSVTITSNGSNPTLTMPLSGTGTAAVGQLAVSPTTLAIGSVVVGTSGSASGSLTASGGGVTVTAASTNNSAFSIGGLSLPLTIPAGQSASFSVTFSPQATGAATGTLTFSSNAQTPTITEALTGTGTPAPTYSVNLSWTASTSSNISGYNIYRAVYTTACGTFAKVNSSLDTTTAYTDTVVVDGTNYCYATTAVNASNEESSYSNIVSDVQIPAP